MSSKQVFYDPKGRRSRRFSGIVAALGLVVAVLTTVFVLSLLALPTWPAFAQENHRLQIGLPALPKPEKTSFLLAGIKHDLAAEIRRTRPKYQKPETQEGPVVAAFFAPEQETGLQSMKMAAPGLTHVIPDWLHLTPEANRFDASAYDLNPRNHELVKEARESGVRISPIFSNANQGEFRADTAAKLLHSPADQEALAQRLTDWLVGHRFQGLNVDFEDLHDEDYALMPGFLQLLKRHFAPNHLGLSADLEVSNDVIPYAKIADPCDFVVLMVYDEHFEEGPAGPIASIDWCQKMLDKGAKDIPAEKLVLGIGNYSLDWEVGKNHADSLTFQEALANAKGYRDDAPPSKVIQIDPDSLNSTFAYRDDDDVPHRVWMLDAASAYNQWLAARDYGIRGAAVWALGEEDPGIWTFLNKNRLDAPMNTKALEHVRFQGQPDFVGRGEILTVQDTPQPGSRTIETDPSTGLIVRQAYQSYPLPYIIKKSGYHAKELALTFDDGPDGAYTPEILDELKKLGVQGTFFVVGKNAEAHPDLIAREYDEGNEIGSHTFTHANIGEESTRRVELELNATQRAIQSIIGHSTVLFRPPYNADSEPQTPEEVRPVAMASQMGYVVVAENVDPTDWDLRVPLPNGGYRTKTAEDISHDVIADINQRAGTDDEGNIILLHDFGGDRSATIKALDTIVPRLEKEGYHFVTVSKMLGLTRDQVMPPISPRERLMILVDKVVFGVAFTLESFLAISFVLAIFLGLARIGIVTPLALYERAKAKHAAYDPDYRPTVSVLIAAYNEERVIVRTVESVLGSEYVPHEVIVIDDGSRDETAAAVRAAYDGDPRVRLIVQPNGGKASALNNGIATATGEILVCIDADTQLAPNAIGKMVRHFQSAEVAAVAGNVKVGNLVNVLTRWQSIEYTTSQNVDRRAYSQLNAITVVPGAVGAWRKSAVVQVGAYVTDTLAEDMDLTWRLRRAGYRNVNEPEALAYTEAPDTFRGFFKQRFRWAFGTLQCLWKHRKAVGHYGWFGGLALPSLWLFQIVFQALAPLIDIQILYSIYGYYTALMSVRSGNMEIGTSSLPAAQQSLAQVLFLYALFFGVELISAFIAYRMDREKPTSLWWLFLQRFAYRQVMYGVVYKSLVRAARGTREGWGKVERKASVKVPKAL